MTTLIGKDVKGMISPERLMGDQPDPELVKRFRRKIEDHLRKNGPAEVLRVAKFLGIKIKEEVTHGYQD